MAIKAQENNTDNKREVIFVEVEIQIEEITCYNLMLNLLAQLHTTLEKFPLETRPAILDKIIKDMMGKIRSIIRGNGPAVFQEYLENLKNNIAE